MSLADPTPETDVQTAVETPTEVASSEAVLSEAEKYAQLYDQFLRLQADFQNYRKRIESEKEGLLKYGAERTLTALLPVLDNLERGTNSLSETSDPKLLFQSFRLVYNQLLEGLSAQGLRKMEVVGLPFDPFYHEAVSRTPSAEHPENHVANELQSGFLLYDRVLRPAMVMVSDGAAGESTTTEASPQADANAANPFKANA